MKTSLTRMTVTLTAIAAVMGAALSIVHEFTLEPISEAQLNAKNEALAAVLPPFDNNPSDAMTAIELPEEARPLTVYTATSAGEDVGYAIESYTTDGFSGEITVMVGFDASGAVYGYKVLQHAETPGLGAKADAWFQDPTGNRSIIGSTAALTVAKDGGEIDGITAATITSRAFLDAVNRARKAFESVTSHQQQ